MIRLSNKAIAPARVEIMANVHPCVFFVVSMVCVPLGILAAVFAATFAVMLPVPFFEGWL